VNIRPGIIAAAIVFAATVRIFALDVDEDELSTTKGTSVEFVNYEGPHDRIDTIEEILGIGRALARASRGAGGAATVAGKYRIVHAVDSTVTGKLDADILFLLAASEVDHIENVRRILAGYLETAYSYSLPDALLLAEFITIYNAVYRGRFAYFTENYKPVVMKHLSAEAVGIATVYSKWPGATEIVIPLSERALTGGLGSLDSDVLTEDAVVDELRTREDRGIPERKEITELKEREVEEAQREIDADRKAVEQTRETVDRELEEISTDRAALAAARDEARDAGDEERAKEIEEKEEELAEREALVEETREKLDEEERAIDRREQEEEERIERIQTEREEIASEERELLEEQAPDGATTGLAGILSAGSVEQAVLFQRVESGSPSDGRFSRLLYIDPATGTIVSHSRIDSIMGRRFYEISGGLLVIAGDRSPAGEEQADLVLLDKLTLDELSRSGRSIHPESFVKPEEGETVLAVVSIDGEWVLGRFDGALSLLVNTEEPVYPQSVIVVSDDFVYAQSEDGNITTYDRETLERTGSIE
jgi:hypothetical protein